MPQVNTMVRVGIVSDRDTGDHRVRAYFPDMNNMVSGWLLVLRNGASFPSVNDRVLILYPYGYEMDGYVLGVIP